MQQREHMDDFSRQSQADLEGETAFERGALEVLTKVQGTLEKVIAAIPARIKKSTDLQRALSLDPKLAWQVFKFTSAPSVLPASTMLPGIVALQRFLTSAHKKGVPKTTTKAALDAFTQFEQFVATHAGDRTSFNSMAGGAVSASAQAIALAHKKAAFRAAAHFLGVKTEICIVTFILHPSLQSTGEWDLATTVYKLGVRRLRPDARVMLGNVSPSTFTGQQGVADVGYFAPLEKTADLETVASLLTPFCSSATAETILTHRKGAHLELELAAGGIGTTASTDWAIGVVERNSNILELGNTTAHFAADIAAAAQTLVVDILLHESVPPEPTSVVQTYLGFLGGQKPQDVRADYARLAITESVVSLGQGITALQLAEVPRYGELISYSCNQLGWNRQSFRAYRCRVEYPLLGSSLDILLGFRK